MDLPYRRDERPTLICVNCGAVMAATSKCTGHSDGKQSWCQRCMKEYKTNRERVAREKQLADIEAREARETLCLLHEKGRHETPNPHCPICKAEDRWLPGRDIPRAT